MFILHTFMVFGTYEATVIFLIVKSLLGIGIPNTLTKVREIQNNVTSRQINRYGYHSIGNSRFIRKNVSLSF